jgi:hypothetical protein
LDGWNRYTKEIQHIGPHQRRSNEQQKAIDRDRFGHPLALCRRQVGGHDHEYWRSAERIDYWQQSTDGQHDDRTEIDHVVEDPRRKHDVHRAVN